MHNSYFIILVFKKISKLVQIDYSKKIHQDNLSVLGFRNRTNLTYVEVS